MSKTIVSTPLSFCATEFPSSSTGPNCTAFASNKNFSKDFPAPPPSPPMMTGFEGICVQFHPLWTTKWFIHVRFLGGGCSSCGGCTCWFCCCCPCPWDEEVDDAFLGELRLGDRPPVPLPWFPIAASTSRVNVIVKIIIKNRRQTLRKKELKEKNIVNRKVFRFYSSLIVFSLLMSFFFFFFFVFFCCTRRARNAIESPKGRINSQKNERRGRTEKRKF